MISSHYKLLTVAAALIGSIGIISIGFAILNQHKAPVPKKNLGKIHAEPLKLTSLSYSPPQNIYISRLNIESSVIEVGKEADGTIEVPKDKNFHKAAWYRDSPSPGQVGASVIQAHLDDPNGKPSLFFKLGDMQPGDHITVKRTDNIAATFEVTTIRQYSKNKFPISTVFNAPGPELRLITCGGAINSSGEYDSNTIVFAKFISSK